MKGGKLLSLLKDSRVLLVLALVAIVAGLIVIHTTQEHMTGKNPVVTILDVGTLTTGKLSANMQTLRDWIAKNGPAAAKPGSPAEVIFANSVALYGQAISVLQTAPTVPEFAMSYATLYDQNPTTVASGSPLLSPADVLADYDLKDKSPGGLYTYYVFQYYFTDSLPPPPTPPKSSVPVTAPATLAGSTKPVSVPLTGIPAPAASPVTQPSPIGAGIPTPCHPSYQSIPGGSIEYRCFS